MKSTRSRVVALIVLVPLGLAGCGGSPVKATTAAPTAAPAASDADPGAGPGTGSSSAAVASVPDPGSTLASSTQDGKIFAVANAAGQGFTIGDDVVFGPGDEKSTLQTYGVDGTSLVQLSSGFSAGCGLADVTNSKGRLVVTENVTEKQAEGINPALYSLSVTAFDARTGAAVWSDKLITDTEESLGCAAGGVDDLTGFAATSDGHYGALSWQRSDSVIDLAVDLTDGVVHPRQDLVGVLGNYLLTGSDRGQDDNGHPNKLTLTTPDGWPALGYIPATDANGPQSTATGWLANGDGSDQSGAGVTPDGTRLIQADRTESSGYTEHDYVDGYLLPAMTRAWRYTSPPSTRDQVLAVTDHLVLVNRSDQSQDNQLIGLDAVTGKQLWSTDIRGGGVCVSTASQALVDANEQLATLDATTGKQLGYNANIKHTLLGDGDAGCPTVLGNGLAGIGSVVDGSQLTVIQLIKP